jgi:TnpA family transposase
VLYIFRNRKWVDRAAWKIKPAGYADDEIVIQQWDEILRIIATIKLKEVAASDLFRRLNSYSKQHALYRALKAFGQIPKSLFILQVIDDPVLRQAIEKQMDRIEHVHRFTRAVSVGNPREFLQAEKEDQEMAEAKGARRSGTDGYADRSILKASCSLRRFFQAGPSGKLNCSRVSGRRAML